ncbi:MAG TPA: tRNA guanosine(34) transglycosylase Tgt, partial [Leptospiraceae bacterium]|nr:tRNA guanosine(34) transglycosylase Tgt [Leptospiraceae bacterium]
MNGRLDFQLEAEASDSHARAGRFRTLHGEILTPLFMPVGTNATVKGLRFEDLAQSGSQILLANTYHLLLRPGPEVFQTIGGIHNLTHWRGSFLTDSGGFQIFSLSHARSMSEEGAAFRSYVDGRMIVLTPELSIATQKAIGSDIMMVLDQCIPSTADFETAKRAMELTHRWARRSLNARGESPQSMFGIVQGAMYSELRRQSAEVLTQMEFD